MIIGASGHQQLPASARAYAETRIRAVLAEQTGPVTGVCSLAEGADQLFARLVLAVGGTLHVVIPSRGYESTFEGEAQRVYRELLGRADTVTELDFPEPGEQAYYAAGHHVVKRSDLLVAVWDGQPARGLGGTADAVAHARELGRDVVIVWPEGVRRT